MNISAVVFWGIGGLMMLSSGTPSMGGDDDGNKE